MRPYTGVIILIVIIILFFGGLKAYYNVSHPQDIIINTISIDRDTNNTTIKIYKGYDPKNVTIDSIKINNESIDSLIPKEKLDSLKSENEVDTISD